MSSTRFPPLGPRCLRSVDAGSPSVIPRAESRCGALPRSRQSSRIRTTVAQFSVAGDMNYESFEAHDAVDFDTITNLYWPLTAFGVKASYPSFDVERFLSPIMLERYHDVTTKGCWYYAYARLPRSDGRRQSGLAGTSCLNSRATIRTASAPTGRSADHSWFWPVTMTPP